MIGAAVVGTGFGGRVHVPALRNAGFEVHALVGRDPEKTARRAARLEVPHACTSMADALAIPDVDAVTIATPPATHALLAMEAVMAGRHVICEKPFALDGAEARAMVRAADRAGVVALVGHEFRWAEDRAVVGRAIEEGRIGLPKLATLVSYMPLVADPAAPAPDWWFDLGRGGGWLGASGSHLIDQVRVWFGEVESVSAGLTVVSQRDVDADDTFTVLLHMDSGAQVMLQQTAGTWGPMAGMTRVAGSRGTLWVEGDEVWLADREGTRVIDVPDDLKLPPAQGVSDDPRHRFTHMELGPYTRLAEAFRDAIQGEPWADDGPIPATFFDGEAEMDVMDAVRQSARSGGASVTVG
jgi:predicted dehydrogenase